MKDISRKRRLKNALLVSIVIMMVLTIKTAWIQFIQGEELQTKAYAQQTLDRKINPKRGIIYDTNGNELAISSTVYTITVNPSNIEKENREKIAQKLSEIFDLEYESVLKKISKRSSIETIIRKQEKEKTDKLRIWMNENNIKTGINIDEDTKRYYPYSNLASHIIGFCGSDNQGLEGIEAKYDKVLSGSKGRITRVTDASGTEVDNLTEQYIDAIDGNDIVLTIDLGVQSIAEKYLEEACIDNVCTDGGNVIIMNPKNGDILAMATYPSYNLNEPYNITQNSITNELTNKGQSEKLQAIWRNKAISDTYEPGSTFKLVTASAALEEGITSTDNAGEFCCTGSITIAGTRIRCWRYYRPHGSQSLREALMNSCNPIFIGLGQKIGVEKYYKYLEKFGFLGKTSIDLPGEAKGIFLEKNKVGPVELATISFGQRFEVTPIQMISMVSTIANYGERLKPRLVKKIIDKDSKEELEIKPEIEENAISEKTAKDVLSMMQSVVATGTGKNASVQGYNIGGKTGTSEDGVNTNKYVTSFVGIAPISDPEVTILVTLYNPTGEGGHQGGAVAAPVAGKILSEVLPYLELKEDNNETKEEVKTVTVPDLKYKTIKEAKEILEEIGLGISPSEEDLSEKSVITSQVPTAGISVITGTNIKVSI